MLVLGYLDPLVTAKQLATIDWLSRGRVDAGVGVGNLRPEFDVAGKVAFADRGQYADEFIDVLSQLWAPGPASYAGEFFTLDARRDLSRALSARQPAPAGRRKRRAGHPPRARAR